MSTSKTGGLVNAKDAFTGSGGLYDSGRFNASGNKPENEDSPAFLKTLPGYPTVSSDGTSRSEAIHVSGAFSPETSAKPDIVGSSKSAHCSALFPLSRCISGAADKARFLGLQPLSESPEASGSNGLLRVPRLGLSSLPRRVDSCPRPVTDSFLGFELGLRDALRLLRLGATRLITLQRRALRMASKQPVCNESRLCSLDEGGSVTSLSVALRSRICCVDGASLGFEVAASGPWILSRSRTSGLLELCGGRCVDVTGLRASQSFFGGKLSPI